MNSPAFRSTQQVDDLRASLAASGYLPVPVFTGEKRPSMGFAWGHKARQGKVDPATGRTLNTGVLCDELRVIDEDVDDEDAAREIAELAREMLGDAPERRRANSPRRLLVYRAAEGAPEKRTIVGAKGKIEVLGKGQQFVAFGTHPSGAELEWLERSLADWPVADLAPVTEDQISAFLDAAKPILGVVEPAEIRVNGTRKPAEYSAPFRPSPPAGGEFFSNVNHRALKCLSLWVPSIFPSAKFQQSTGAFRITSRDLGRDLEEDLSIAPNGIVDFGVADMGDPRDGKRSAIDICLEHGGHADPKAAAFWLCGRMGTTPESLGWGAQDRANAEAAAAQLHVVGGREVYADRGQGEPGKVMPLRPVQADDPDPVDLWQSFDPPALPRDVLPSIIEQFAVVQGEVMGADPGGLAMAALVVCAAAIPDRIMLQVKRHDPSWLESARLWTALVGLPSTKKSPILSAAARPLIKIDNELFREYARSCAKYDALPKGEKAAGDKPRQVRARIEDTTIEAVQEVLKDSPDGVLLMQDELSGWFGSMDKYSGQRGASADRAFWLRSFNGGSYAINRVGRGVGMIENVSISMLGGIQPDLFRKFAADTQDDGLMQRMLPIVLAPAALGRDEPSPDIASHYAGLIERLHRMDVALVGGDGNLAGAPTHLRFDDEAQKIRGDLERRHMELQSIEAVDRKLAAHIGKYDGIFARLCVVFHCIENGHLKRPPAIVEGATARRVATFLHSFCLRHAFAFYHSVLGFSETNDTLASIAAYILAHPKDPDEITIRDVQRGDRTMRSLDYDEATRLLERLEYFGWLLPTAKPRNGTAPRWCVNPRVRNLYHQRGIAEAQRRKAAREQITTLMRG